MGAGTANAARGKALAETLAAELKVLDTPPEVPGGTSMAQVSTAAEAVSHGATKLQMLFAEGNDVPEDAVGSIFGDFHTQIIAFMAYAVSALGSQGVTFDSGVVSATRAVSNSCAHLAIIATATQKPSGDLNTCLAEVWATCAAFKKLPKDARVAVSKALLRSAAVVKDVVTELSEIGGGEENQNPDEDKAERHEDDLLFDDDDFDEHGLAVAKGCAEFAGASFEFLRALVAPIVRGTSTETSAMERALCECVKFQRAVEEVGAGAYPPQDLNSIKNDAIAALSTARAMGTAIGEACDVEAAGAATNAFELAYENLSKIMQTGEEGR